MGVAKHSPPEYEVEQAIVRVCKPLKGLVAQVEMRDVGAACISAAILAGAAVCYLHEDGS